MAQSYFKITLDDGLTSSLTLTNNPAGIEDFEIEYRRHEVYGTIFRSIGGSLRFVKEGAAYIKAVFEEYGIDGVIDITIEEIVLENKTYAPVYVGIIDFSNYTEDEDFVEVGILDNSIMAKFLAREETEVNIIDTKNIDNETITNPMPDPVDLVLSPINPVLWAETDPEIFENRTGISSNATHTYYPTGDVIDNYMPGEFDTANNKYTNNDTFTKSIRFLYTFYYDFTGIINVISSPGTPDGIRITLNVKRWSDGSIISTQTFIRNNNGSDNFEFSDSITADYTATIAAGASQGIYVQIVCQFIGVATGTIDYELNLDFTKYEINYKDTTTTAQTTIEAFKPIDVGNMLLEQMGIDSTTYPFTSGVFGAGQEFENILLTNGKRIRGWQGVALNTSFRKFFENYGKALGLLFYYSESVGFKFEKYYYFYDTASGGVGINSVSNVQFSLAENLYFNKVTVGYENQDYDEVNGSIEFNTEFEYALSITNTKNDLNLVCEYRADSLGIEFTRRNQKESTGTQDNDADSDIFMISAVEDGALLRAELGSDFTSIEGIKEADQYYNYRLSPKSNLMRNGFKLLTSLYYKDSADKIVKYVKSKNDIDLVIDGIEEKGTDTGGTEFVKPVYMTFDTQLTPDLRTFLDTDPNTIIEVLYKGAYVYGFLEEAKINLYKNEANIKIVLN